ncbi:hypothetical protein [Agrobacterium sp. CG674]
MGQVKRHREWEEHATSVAEEILVRVGFFERCDHYTLVARDTSVGKRNVAMAEATKFAQANSDYSQKDMTSAVAKVIDDSGSCASCANRKRRD